MSGIELYFVARPEYNAEPADVWSCGVVLVTMLTGELPWDKPTIDQVLDLTPFEMEI